MSLREALAPALATRLAVPPCGGGDMLPCCVTDPRADEGVRVSITPSTPPAGGRAVYDVHR
jgi:hypothetical protein